MRRKNGQHHTHLSNASRTNTTAEAAQPNGCAHVDLIDSPLSQRISAQETAARPMTTRVHCALGKLYTTLILSRALSTTLKAFLGLRFDQPRKSMMSLLGSVQVL
jgi:hypothetical protein